MRNAAGVWLLAAGAMLLVSGCGQKGPLYLPDKGGKVVTSPPAAAAEPAPAAAPVAAPAAAPPVKPTDQDKDQEQPPKP